MKIKVKYKDTGEILAGDLRYGVLYKDNIDNVCFLTSPDLLVSIEETMPHGRPSLHEPFTKLPKGTKVTLIQE